MLSKYFQFCLALSTILVASQYSRAQEKPTREQFVSDASFFVATHQPDFGKHKPEEMAKAANAFLETRGEKLGSKVRHKLTSSERRQWTNLPARRDAGGVRFGEMNEKQIRAACDLMATLFSEQGYRKMINIMIADDQLLRGGRARAGFGTEDFAIVIFGKPSASGDWAFQLDGHHVGVNVSIKGEKLTMSPSFIGTQPEAFKITKKVRPLGQETDSAYELLGSLTKKQLAKAIVSGRRGRIMTGPGNDGKVPEAKGLVAANMTDEQKEKLLALIGHWVNDMPEFTAKAEMESIKAEIDKVHFAWSGPKEKGGDISFAIQGPSVIIEYACQQLGGNPRDHLHTMYRNPKKEYLGQLK